MCSFLFFEFTPFYGHNLYRRIVPIISTISGYENVEMLTF